MTNADRVLAAIIANPGASDIELVDLSGVRPKQQINQICLRLVDSGRVNRRHRPDGLLGTYPAEGTARPSNPLAPRPQPSRPDASGYSSPAADLTVAVLPPPRQALILFPCSSEKRSGGQAGLSGPSVLEGLERETARRLVEVRQRVADDMGLDHPLLRPALERYSGAMYDAAAGVIARAVRDGQRFVVLSGGYGLLHPHEPIGWYNRQFRAGDWRQRVLQDALIELTRRCQLSEVVAFCARTGGYADVVRSTRWASSGIRAHLVTPIRQGGSAQQTVPPAYGEALSAYLSGTLHPGWTSSAGLALNVEALR